MNIRKTTLSSLFFLFLIVTSCTKDGEIGPAGPRGERGIAGGDGTRIYSGATTPAYTLGRVGDFYFHTGTGDFYGPKTAEGGWGIPTNLKGDNGNRIYGNAISPTNSVGTIGDFYINTFDGNTQVPHFLWNNSWGRQAMQLITTKPIADISTSTRLVATLNTMVLMAIDTFLFRAGFESEQILT